MKPRPQNTSTRGGRWIGLTVAALLGLGWGASAPAAETGASESFSFSIGVADRNHGYEPVENTYLARLGFRSPWFSRRSRALWNWRGFWEFEAGYWRWADKGPRRDGKDELAELAATPVFRLERSSAFASGARPFVQVAIGAHLISETVVSSRDLGSNFHFGSHLGGGWYFGNHDRFELSFHIQHLSNAGIKEPNPGINFGLVKFAIRP